MEFSKNFAMYLLYMVLKLALHWMVIVFKDSSNVVCNGLSSTYRMIAIYKGTPYLYSFLIYLYNTFYAAGLVMDIRHEL